MMVYRSVVLLWILLYTMPPLWLLSSPGAVARFDVFPNRIVLQAFAKTFGYAAVVSSNGYTSKPDTTAVRATAPVYATEICNNGIDDDGDGLIDCADCADCAGYDGCRDTDDDNINNICDLDDDNDGIPDLDECPSLSYGPELVRNGGFENGYAHWTAEFNRGFNNRGPTSDGCSDQGWVAITACAATNGICSQYFNYSGSQPTGSILITADIGTEPNIINTTPCTLSANGCEPGLQRDHTPGGGLSLYIDPSDVPGRAYWQQTVSVTPNTAYEFSAWFLVIEEDPSLIFSIGGAPIGPAFNLDRTSLSSSGPEVWQQFSIEWNSGATNGLVLIELRNETAGCNGNDIRLDDISMRSKLFDCDADNDGISNLFDLDSDNDGIFDLDEAGHTANDVNADGVVDGSRSTFRNNGLSKTL